MRTNTQSIWIWLGLTCCVGCSLGVDLSQPWRGAADDDPANNGVNNGVNNGTNHSVDPGPPIADAGADQSVAPGALVVLDGRGSSGPADATFAWRQISGAEVVIAEGLQTPTFAAPIGRQALVFELTVSAGEEIAEDQVQVFVENSAPTADAGADVATEGGAAVVLDASASADPDGDELTFRWTQMAGPDVAIGDDVSQSITLTPAAVRADYTFKVNVSDGHGGSDTDEVVLSVGNHAPVARAGADVEMPAGAVVQLDGTGSTDADGDALTYAWTQMEGESSPLDDARSPTPRLRLPLSRQTLLFALVVSDGSVDSAPAEVALHVANSAPVVEIAGPAEVGPGGDVDVDATGSTDPDGDTLEFMWSVVEGDVTVTDPTQPGVRFRAPPFRSLVRLAVVVTDPFGASDEGEIEVSVGNTLPVVDAGPDVEFHVRDIVVLQGLATDGDGDELTLVWTQTEGPTVETRATQARLQFTAPPVPSQLTFELAADDGLVVVRDTVVVRVGNAAPTANAGPDAFVDQGVVVALDGSASDDPDGDTLAYTWTQVSGAPISLQNAGTVRPTFTSPQGGQVLEFELSVHDGVVSSPVDSVAIGVRNGAPTARAQGPDLIDPGAMFTLTGSGSSDPDGDALRYEWRQISGDAAEIIMVDGASIAASAPLPRQQMTFELTVDDGYDSMDTATVTVGIRNNRPVADPGPALMVDPGATVVVTGSASSDADGDPLSFRWRQVGNDDVLDADLFMESFQFTAPSQRAIRTFGLTVSDDFATSTERLLQVSVRNSPPVVNAGPDQTNVEGGHEVTLDGRGTSDVDDDELVYSWNQIEGQQVSLDDPSDPQPRFDAGLPRQAYVFELTVTDGFDGGTPDRVTVTTR